MTLSRKVVSYSLVEVYQSFGDDSCFHHQGDNLHLPDECMTLKENQQYEHICGINIRFPIILSGEHCDLNRNLLERKKIYRHRLFKLVLCRVTVERPHDDKV